VVLQHAWSVPERVGFGVFKMIYSAESNSLFQPSCSSRRVCGPPDGFYNFFMSTYMINKLHLFLFSRNYGDLNISFQPV
jgi:hypothetical protein